MEFLHYGDFCDFRFLNGTQESIWKLYTLLKIGFKTNSKKAIIDPYLFTSCSISFSSVFFRFSFSDCLLDRLALFMQKPACRNRILCKPVFKPCLVGFVADDQIVVFILVGP